MSKRKEIAAMIIFWSIGVGLVGIIYLLETRYPEVLALILKIFAFAGMAFIVITVIATIIWSIIILLSPDDEKKG